MKTPNGTYIYNVQKQCVWTPSQLNHQKKVLAPRDFADLELVRVVPSNVPTSIEATDPVDGKIRWWRIIH